MRNVFFWLNSSDWFFFKSINEKRTIKNNGSKYSCKIILGKQNINRQANNIVFFLPKPKYLKIFKIPKDDTARKKIKLSLNKILFNFKNIPPPISIDFR